jgi:hypothetical protein
LQDNFAAAGAAVGLAMIYQGLAVMRPGTPELNYNCSYLKP